jgi:hypothetical protein
MAVVQVGYLRGQRTPVIERGEANFNTLGMAMRGYFDFGVALHDSRCGVLSGRRLIAAGLLPPNPKQVARQPDPRPPFSPRA